MGVDIISTLSRKNGANFPIALGEDVIGAFVTVATTGARDAIPTNILRTGALVRIAGTNNFYEWSGSVWSLYSGFGSSGHTIKEEGVAVTPRTSLNFVGVNVALSDDGSNTIVTIGAVSLTAGVSGILPVANGGTGLSAGGTNGNVLTMVSGAPAWAAPGGGSLTAPANPADDGKLAIASGGNFAYAFLANANVSSSAAIVLSKLADGSACSVAGRSANSSGAHADIASSADGEVFRRAGGALGWGTIATAGIADSAVTLAKLANATAVSILGRSANSAGAYADIAAGTNGFVYLRRSNVITAALLLDENFDPSAALAWSKFASAIGNVGFSGLKSLTYNSEIATTGATPAVDFTTGDLQKTTLNANATPTFTAPAAGVGWVQWHVLQDGTGGRSITFPGSVVGSPPQPNLSANAHTFYAFFWDGTNFRFVSSGSTALLTQGTLTGANQTVHIGTAQDWTMAAGLTSGAAAVTVDPASGTPVIGEVMSFDVLAQGHNVTVQNGGSGYTSSVVVTAGTKRRITATFTGADYLIEQLGRIA